ncbi:uncharacterized protein LOC144334032 [Macaca mulatta]
MRQTLRALRALRTLRGHAGTAASPTMGKRRAADTRHGRRRYHCRHDQLGGPMCGLQDLEEELQEAGRERPGNRKSPGRALFSPGCAVLNTRSPGLSPARRHQPEEPHHGRPGSMAGHVRAAGGQGLLATSMTGPLWSLFTPSHHPHPMML